MAENQNTEWKESWRDEYLKWICGFANAQGGKIFIGTRDDGTVVGVFDSKKLLEDIPNKVRDILGIIVDVNLFTEEKKDYIEIVIPAVIRLILRENIIIEAEAQSSFFVGRH